MKVLNMDKVLSYGDIEVMSKDNPEDSAEDEEPPFDGLVMGIPWIYMDMKIGRPRGETEEPICISQKENSHEPIMIINLLEREGVQ